MARRGRSEQRALEARRRVVGAVLESREVALNGHLEPFHGLSRQRVGRGALAVAQRLAQLTPQQFRVFGMLCAGRLNKQIAHDLRITEATVKAHMTAILRKLGASNRTQAALLAGGLAIAPYEFAPQPEGVE